MNAYDTTTVKMLITADNQRPLASEWKILSQPRSVKLNSGGIESGIQYRPFCKSNLVNFIHEIALLVNSQVMQQQGGY